MPKGRSISIQEYYVLIFNYSVTSINFCSPLKCKKNSASSTKTTKLMITNIFIIAKVTRLYSGGIQCAAKYSAVIIAHNSVYYTLVYWYYIATSA